ncbi:MAG: urea ABC transporter permease subunit UrtB [Methylovulum sp.]|nr:urea ABC transporter permease subunit UrtB [Methylovulum sp.]
MTISPLTRRYPLIALLMLVFSLAAHSGEAPESQPWLDALDTLKKGSMPAREKAILQLAEIKDAHNLAILQALLDGKLYLTKTDAKLVIGTDNHQGFDISNAINGASLGVVEHDALSKINLTNKMRGTLRKIIGELELSADDPKVRLAAVKAMAKDADEKALALLRERGGLEQDEAVRAAIKLTLLLQDMDSEDKGVRIKAIEGVKGFDSQEAANRLNAMVEKDENGEFMEPDGDIRDLAKAALININSRLQLYSSIETVFFGLSLGAVLVLSAIGLAITFGVMGVINMAHGELMMLGAYTTYVMQQLMPNYLGWSIILSIPAAFVISALVGIAIERGIIRFLYGRPLETLLATFGVSLILQQSVRSIFSPLNRSVATPEWMSGSWQINDFLSLTWNRFYILVFCLLVFVLLLQILKRTRLGLEVRAVAQNRKMAKAMGIPTARVDAMTFGLGSGIAGVAGVALSQITNVGPNLGQAYIVDSFMVVVFGGVGNLLGTLVAGFSLGIANKFLEPFAGAVLAKILVLVFIILFIQKRPRGLFPQKGRAADS